MSTDRRKLRHGTRARKKGANPALTVSDHAIVRYLERYRGLDREALEAEMLTDDLVEQVRVLGGSGRFLSEGRRVIVSDFVVVTIHPPKENANGKKKIGRAVRDR